MGWQIKTKEGALYGPVDSETLSKWIQKKRVLNDDFVWMEDKSQWVVIKSVSQLRDLFKEESVSTTKKQELLKVNIPTAKDLSETLYDDKKILTDQLIADAWRAMLVKGIWSIIGAILLMAIVVIGGAITITIVTVIIEKIIPQYLPVHAISWVTTEFIWFLIVVALVLGWSAYSLKIARRETVNVGSIFEGCKGQYVWHALGGYLLVGLLTALAGLVSFGIWGFYLYLAYILVYFFIFDENKGPWEAMKTSYDITKGYKWRIVSIQVVCMILGILFLGIGLFVTMPLAHIALASLYYRIRTGRISEKHLRTSFGEYLIVLIAFILMITLIVIIFASLFMKELPFLPPQVAHIIKNLFEEQFKR